MGDKHLVEAVRSIFRYGSMTKRIEVPVGAVDRIAEELGLLPVDGAVEVPISYGTLLVVDVADE